jgi:hypothetical protein
VISTAVIAAAVITLSVRATLRRHHDNQAGRHSQNKEKMLHFKFLANPSQLDVIERIHIHAGHLLPAATQGPTDYFALDSP